MQILEAAHLFFQLIGYEFYRNDHISSLSVITGGTQINSTVDANAEELEIWAADSHIPAWCWHLLTESLLQDLGTKKVAGWRAVVGGSPVLTSGEL